VDGYDAAGERVYDRVRGKTCHQCRQKTIGKRTQCSHCQSADVRLLYHCPDLQPMLPCTTRQTSCAEPLQTPWPSGHTALPSW